MKKISSIFLIIILSLGLLTGCSSNKTNDTKVKEENKTVKVTVPDGLPAMSVAKLIKENPEISKAYEVKYSIEKTPETLSTSVMKEEPDIAIVPSNMAAIAYNKTKNYQIAATTGFGSFYIISTEDLKSYNDLKGKTILNMGKGLTPDITAQSILKDRGINITSDVTFNYVNGVPELVPMVVSGKEKIAVVPEPALTALMEKKKDVKIFKSLNDEYKTLNNSEYGFPQATLIVKKSFLAENKEFVNSFLSNVEKSVIWANKNKKDLAAYCESIGVSTEKGIIENSLDRANIKYAFVKNTIEEYKKYYKKLFDFNPKSVGGTMPDEGIFMEK